MNEAELFDTLTATATARGFKDPRPLEGGRAQCNAKIEALAYWRFKRACVLRGESYASVLERVMEIYVAQVEGTRVLHLDGQECPLSVLITGLADSARDMVKR